MDDFSKVKQVIAINSVITLGGGERKGRFINPSACCGHNDCLSIDDDKNAWHCFSCGKGGSAIDYVMMVEGCDAHSALERCAKIANVSLTPKRRAMTKVSETVQERIYRLATEYYQRNITEGTTGYVWFCVQRGHLADTLDAMGVGWSDGGLFAYLKEEHSFTIEDCVGSGLVRDKDKNGKPISPKDYFWEGLAIFPVVNHKGKTVSFTCKDPLKKYPGLNLAGGVKNWFLNHAALGKYPDLIVVEGQNDVASLFDVGIYGVVGTSGFPSEEQATLLKNSCGQQTVYLWFDKDAEKDPRKNDGGPRHTRYICKALMGSGVKVRIIEHSGTTKDPDEYIQKLMKEGKPLASIRSTVNALKSGALDPIGWEIERLRLLESSKDKLDVLKERSIPELINAVESNAEREVYAEMIAEVVGISRKSVDDLIVSSMRLRESLVLSFGGEGEVKKADGTRLAKHIYDWFSNGAGGRFFKTGDGKTWLFFKGKIYELTGSNLDFESLIYSLTGLSVIEKPGPVLSRTLQILCNLNGEYVDMTSWLYTDKESDTVYLNLSTHHNKIIQLSPGEDPQVIDNGTNQNSVLLMTSPQIRPFTYQAQSEAEGVSALKRLFIDTIPIEQSQRYFITCWVISTFLMGYQSDRGLLQIIGNSAVGKSKVAERISQLVYGENFNGRGSNAAGDRTAVDNPIVFQDNLENKNITEIKKEFLLLLANSSMKPKAKSGSDRDIVYQRLNSMGVITSIEIFPGKIPELVNRTYTEFLEPQYKIAGYNHDETMRQISKQRNVMISAILTILSKKVLTRLNNRAEWSTFISTKFPRHNKDRNNEHLCTIMIVLEALLEYLPFKQELSVKEQAVNLLERWITYQEEHSKQTELTSNTLLSLMDGLAKEVWIKIRKRDDLDYQYHRDYKDIKVVEYDDPDYLQTFYLTVKMEEIITEDDGDDDDDGLTANIQRLEMVVTAADLHTIFNRYCASQHIRNPYDSATALGARISNDKDVMVRGGWEYIHRKEDNIHYKKVSGKWYWKFSKKFRVGR